MSEHACGHANLGRALERRLLQEPDREVLVFIREADVPISVRAAQLHEAACRCAAWLREEGLQPQDLVALVLPAGFEFSAAFIGCIYAGVIPAALPYPGRDGGRERRAVVCSSIAGSNARAAITTAAVREQLLESSSLGACKIMQLQLDELATSPADAAPLDCEPDSTAYIQFSSGSSGQPRSAMISHRAILRQLQMLTVILQWRPHDVTVGWLPLFHDMGLITQLLLPAAQDGKAVVMASDHWLRRPALLFHSVAHYRGTMIFMPNFGFEHCLRHVAAEDLDTVDLSTLRSVVNAAEPVQAGTLQRFFERYSRCGLHAGVLRAGYGLAENVLAASCTPPGTQPRVEWVLEQDLQSRRAIHPVASRSENSRAIVSCGPPLAGVAIRIAAADGQPLAERRLGEIEVAGNCLFSGYWHNPLSSAEVLREGWLRTGDLGYLADGELFVCDRLKDLIICGGRNIHPVSIEELAIEAGRGHFKRAAAFGVSGSLPGTQSVVIALEARMRLGASEREALIQAISGVVARSFDVAVEEVTIVPRGWIKTTTSGKLARGATREKYLAAKVLVGTASNPAVFDWIVQLLRQHGGKQDIQPGDNILRLGIDSLNFLQLMLKVEARFQCVLPINALADEPTVARLVQLIEASALPPQSGEPITQTPPELSTQAMQALRLFQSRGDWIARGPPFIHSYFLGHAALRKATAMRSLRERLLRGAARGAAHALAEITGRPCSDALLRHSVFCNCWGIWRRRALATEPQRWLTIHGIDAVHARLAAGQGVVLALPSMAARFAVEHAIHRLPVPLTVVGVERSGLPDSRTVELPDDAFGDVTQRRESLLAHQLLLAQRVLSKGGIAIISGDGPEGRKIPCAFLGRELDFPLGFAELARSAHAIATPVWASLGWDGHITLSFDEPIDPVQFDSSQAMVHEYASWLAARWRSDPANLRWRMLRHFMARPRLVPRRLHAAMDETIEFHLRLQDSRP